MLWSITIKRIMGAIRDYLGNAQGIGGLGPFTLRQVCYLGGISAPCFVFRVKLITLLT